jgi:hypothetical protein
MLRQMLIQMAPVTLDRQLTFEPLMSNCQYRITSISREFYPVSYTPAHQEILPPSIVAVVVIRLKVKLDFKSAQYILETLLKLLT